MKHPKLVASPENVGFNDSVPQFSSFHRDVLKVNSVIPVKHSDSVVMRAIEKPMMRLIIPYVMHGLDDVSYIMQGADSD